MTNSKKRFLILFGICFILLWSIKLHFVTGNQTAIQIAYLNNVKKVYTPEWGVVATITEMGYPPLVMGDKKLYANFVRRPKLSSSVIDLGLRGQPSKEVMSQLDLDLIIDSKTYLIAEILNMPNVPIEQVDFGLQTNTRGQIPPWSKYEYMVRLIGKSTQQSEQAERYIDNSKKRIIQAGHNIRKILGDDKKIIVVEFMDDSEMLVTPISNPISLSADMMGLKLISLGKPNDSGWLYKPIHALYDVPENTCLIIKKPVAELYKYNIINSPIWQNSPFAKPDACIYFIDPVWVRGGMYTMVTFAENLEKAVTSQQQNEFSNKHATQSSSNNSSKKGGES